MSDTFPIVSVWKRSDTEYALDGILTTYQSLNFEPRHLEPGSFEMTLPYDTAALAITTDCLLTIDWRGQRTTWCLDRFSPAANEQGDRILTVGGPGAKSILGREIAWPAPALPLAGQPNYELDPDVGRISGNAETVVRTFVQDNYVTRRGGLLTMGVNGNRGATVSGRGQFDNLLELVATKARTGGIGFDVGLVNSSGTRATLTWQAYEPVDRSLEVRLSERVGSLTSWTQTVTAPEVTKALVGSAVTGAGRIYIESTSPEGEEAAAMWDGHRVRFVNGPASYDTPDLEEAAREALAEGVGTTNVALVASDSPGTLAFRDYTVGDRITGQLERGVDVVDVVAGIQVRVENGYPEVTPTFGDPSADEPMLSLAQVMRALARRVRRIEQRGS